MPSKAPRSLGPAVAIVLGIAFLAGSAAAWTSAPFIIFFGFASESLQAPERAKLDRLASILNADSTIHLMISGHADRAGSQEHNHALSCRRARAVRTYLVTKGVAAPRMATQAFGEARPLTDTDDGVDLRVNRRVEFDYYSPELFATLRRTEC